MSPALEPILLSAEALVGQTTLSMETDMRPMLAACLLAFAAAAPAFAQEGDEAGKAMPQEEAFESCTAQAGHQFTDKGPEKNQWIASCLTGKVGQGPKRRSIDPVRQKAICNEQATALKLQGDVEKTFLADCNKRNAELRKQGL